MTGLNIKTIPAAVDKLVLEGLISVKKKGKHTPDYILSITRNRVIQLPEIGITQKRVIEYPENGYSDTPKSGNETKRETKKKLKKKTPVPEDFSITEKMRDWAAKNVPHFDIDSELEAWADYWKGEGELKADWVATWRNGMKSRNARFLLKNQNQPEPSQEFVL